MSDIVESKQNYDKTAASLQNLIQKILEAGEITQDDDNELVDLLTEYDKLYNTITSSIQEQKNKTIRQEIDELKNNKIGATVDDLLNILTENGRKTFIYKDDDNNILIDMKAIPSLVMLVNKFKMIASDGEDESSIVLTPNFIELLSNSDILLKAKNINLEGLVTANGNFKILEDGSIEATNGKFAGEINADSGKISSDLEVEGLNVSGDITTNTLTVSKINCSNLLTTIGNNINIIIDASSTNITDTLENGAIYSSLQKCINDIPKNFNGYIVTITVDSELSERIQVVGFNGGELRIQFNGNLNGFIYTADNTAKVLIRGKGTTTQTLKYNYKTTGNLNMREEGNSSATLVQTLPPGAQLLVTEIDANNWGYTTYNGLSGWIPLNTAYTEKEEVYETIGTSTAIIPDTLVKDGVHQSSVFVDNCNYVSISNIEVYSKTETDSYAIKGYRNSFINAKNVKVNGSENGIIAQLGTKIYTSNMTGKVNNIADNAIMGSTIYIEDGTNINGLLNHDSTSQIIYNSNNVTQDTTSEVGTNDNTSSTSSIVTLNSIRGNAYRHNVYTGWKNDNTARQGDYGYGDCDGIWLFDTQFSSKLKDKTINEITLTVTRQAGGISGEKTATLKMHNHTTEPSGAPTFLSTWSLDFGINVNETKTIKITDSTVLNAIKNGECVGFGVQGTYDKNHYIVFSGNCKITAKLN